jgi:hypothetical protein
MPLLLAPFLRNQREATPVNLARPAGRVEPRPWRAKGMAEAGKKFDEILFHYFPTTNLIQR